jgi:L-asparaginase
MKKRILIINTGGTISCIQSLQGYEPAPGFVEIAMANVSALIHPDMPEYVIKEYDPLLDSSNITVRDWNRIAADIAKEYDVFDGFIVFHGTDTMAYTASALSFMLENLAKPVIITGSQIPLSVARNDAMDNVITALWIAAHKNIPEVCIYFNHQMLRGNRARKVSAQRFHAFESPNAPHLASIGINITNDRLILKKPTEAFNLQTISPHFIANFRLFPGFKLDVLAYILNQPIQGLILETYGAGNAQNNDPAFLNLLKQACDKGIILINSTQCQQGYVEMDQYATGYPLKQAGLISAHDMTPEATHCKLLYLLSKNLDISGIKQAMETDLRGELSVINVQR